MKDVGYEIVREGSEAVNVAESCGARPFEVGRSYLRPLKKRHLSSVIRRGVGKGSPSSQSVCKGDGGATSRINGASKMSPMLTR